MKTLYLDCSMGASGDMLTAALIELLPNPDEFISKMNSLGINNVEIAKETVIKCGIKGTYISVKVNDIEEDNIIHEHHHHEHTHHHEHIHHHSSMNEIESIIANLHLQKKIEKDVLDVYKLIAEAESYVHGMPVSDIHFHEVGTMDAIADIVGVCMLIDEISADEIIVSPIHVGSGNVKCAHGILPVPAPATAYILKDIPIYGGSIKGELCTPTGAALLKHFATRFGDMPIMKVQSIGYGMGKRDFEIANCIRAMLGETKNETDTVLELSCNVDDMTAEAISFAMDCFIKAGAMDVYTTPIGMKKSRPATLIRVICLKQDKDKMIHSIFKHTTTIGIRETITHRYVLDRQIKTLNTPYGEVRCKTSSGYGVSRSKYEYDDIICIAEKNNISFEEAKKLIENFKNN